MPRNTTPHYNRQLQNEPHCTIQAMINFCPNITQISTRKAVETITHLNEPNQTQLKCPMWHKNTVVEPQSKRSYSKWRESKRGKSKIIRHK